MSEAAEVSLKAAEIIGRDPRFSKVVLYGSHAKGTARPDSDIDLAAVTPNVQLIAENFATVKEIKANLEREGIPVGDGPGEVNVLLVGETEFNDPKSSSSPDLLGQVKVGHKQLFPKTK